LRVDGLSRHFPMAGGAQLRAVEQVSFSLAAGEVVALVGESGSGKSTLARTVLGLYDKTAGRVYYQGERLPGHYRAADFRRQAARMQMVFQDPGGTLNPRLTVGESLAEPLLLSGRRSEVAARVADWLGRVGLDPSAAGRYPHEFSGGQRQRLGIARALIAGPALVVCDEPVSALDVSVQAQIVNLLMRLRADEGVALLLIAHDLALVRHIADRVLVMYRGEIVEEAPVARLFAAPQHPYTALLLASCPSGDPARRLPQPAPVQGLEVGAEGCQFAPRCPRATARCQQRPALSEVGEQGRVACHHPLGEEAPRSAT
jgi:oligopeptide/dipeptide ABC transporter ATP-binding protein